MKNCPMCGKDLAWKSQDIYCGRKCRAASIKNRRLKMMSKPSETRDLMQDYDKRKIMSYVTALQNIEEAEKLLISARKNLTYFGDMCGMVRVKK